MRYCPKMDLEPNTKPHASYTFLTNVKTNVDTTYATAPVVVTHHAKKALVIRRPDGAFRRRSKLWNSLRPRRQDLEPIWIHACHVPKANKAIAHLRVRLLVFRADSH